MLVSVGNTGGLASPLLLSLVPFLVMSSMNPNLDRKRPAVLGVFLLGFVLMVSFSNTAIGELYGPLAPNVRWGSGAFIALSFVSATMAALSTFKMGRAISSAYERIALELAVRREELCDESEGRTRALEGIAARLAHEVKNPLAAIKGLSTHVARSSTDEKVRERLTIVASEAERLQEIVEGFLSFSRGLDDLTVGPTKPYDIARELSLLLETRAADAGVTLEVRGSRELTLNADDKKLRQALLNLVLNAMQASTRGTTVTLEVAKSCSDGAAVIRVMDRGAGMAPEILDRIQKPYYTTKEGGSGLGIAVARGIIEQHGGSLRFESTPGRGTTATVHLPACALKAQSKKAKLPEPLPRRGPRRRRSRRGRGHRQPGKSPFLSGSRDRAARLSLRGRVRPCRAGSWSSTTNPRCASRSRPSSVTRASTCTPPMAAPRASPTSRRTAPTSCSPISRCPTSTA